jgi:hypothetical protein
MCFLIILNVNLTKKKPLETLIMYLIFILIPKIVFVSRIIRQISSIDSYISPSSSIDCGFSTTSNGAPAYSVVNKFVFVAGHGASLSRMLILCPIHLVGLVLCKNKILPKRQVKLFILKKVKNVLFYC